MFFDGGGEGEGEVGYRYKNMDIIFRRVYVDHPLSSTSPSFPASVCHHTTRTQGQSVYVSANIYLYSTHTPTPTHKTIFGSPSLICHTQLRAVTPSTPSQLKTFPNTLEGAKGHF